MRKADYEKLYKNTASVLQLPFEVLECTGRSGVTTTFDLIFATAKLQEYLKIAHQFPTQPADCNELMSRLDKPTQLRLKGHSMMLASQYDGLKPEEQKAVFESKDWVFTEKENGIRVWLICIDGNLKVPSRNYAVDCSIPEYSGNIYMPGVNLSKNFALDCELVIAKDNDVKSELAKYGLETSTPLEVTSALLQMNAPQSLKIQKDYLERTGCPLLVFKVITPLVVGAADCFRMPFGKLKPKTDDIIKSVCQLGFPVKAIRSCNGTRAEKEAFLSQIIDIEHGEGVIAANNNSIYIMSENRSKTGFIKIKRSVGAMAAKEGLGDTIDGWVSGFDLGTEGTSNELLVSSLHISITIKEGEQEREHVVAKVPNIALALKKQMTEVVDGVPQLKKEFYGMVAAVSGQALSNVSMRLTHPRMLQFPVAHKQQQDCVYDIEFLKAQMDIF